MNLIGAQTQPALGRIGWQPEVLAALDERHLVAWSDHPTTRLHFAAELQRFLNTQPGSELVVLHGRSILSLDHFCEQLERQLPGPCLERRIDGSRGVTELLRHDEPGFGAGATRARYYIWNDADMLLRADPGLFGLLVDAILGVAAECEFGSGEVLTIHRAVFSGGPMLERYARNKEGQFRCWAPDGSTNEPFWQIVSGLTRPPVLSRPVDLLMRQPHRIGA